MIKPRFYTVWSILLFEAGILEKRNQSQINHSINDLYKSSLENADLHNLIIPNTSRVLKKILQDEKSAKRPWYQRFSQKNLDMQLSQLAQAAQFAEALDRAMQVKSLYDIAHFQWPQIDKQLTILFPPQLLEAIDSLNQISDTLDRVQENTAPLTKTTTMWEVSEQIVLLTRAQYALKELDSGFGQLLALVIGHFADVLKAEGERVRQEQQRGPVPNPYVIGNPVQGQLFVGREDVLRRLTELWGSSGQCPSVVLYGHRRMGKSSVLQNLHRLTLPERSVLVDFNLQRIGRVRSTAELLHALSLKLYDAARKAKLGDGLLVEPAEAEFFSEHKSPYLALDRFLVQLERVRDGHRFLLTIDEFELLEEQIDEGRLDSHLLAAFRATFQTYPWLIMALAGLHRLEELRHDYWHPLFGSVTAIEVSFLSDAAARTLITSPDPDFPIDYDAAAIARILTLTNGQPYLIQLICHSLVSRYNRQVSEEPIPPLRRFFLSDVEAVVAKSELFTDGIRYFQGVWDHALRSRPPGQDALLRQLSRHPEGLTEAELQAQSGVLVEATQPALRALLRHAVIRTDGGRYSITVELLRLWIAALATPKGVDTS